MSLNRPKANLLIPAAGLGLRFQAEGFENPKPMIEHEDKSLLEHSVESAIANFNVQQLVIVLNRQHVEQNRIDAFVKSRYPDAEQYIVNELTRGAAETAFLGISAIENNALPLVINDCDHRFGRISDLDEYQEENWHARINYFASINPRFCFAEVENNFVKRIVEKKVISPFAVAGCYVFRNADIYINAYEKIKGANLGTGEEFISMVVQEIIADGGVVAANEILEHQDLGVPGALISDVHG